MLKSKNDRLILIRKFVSSMAISSQEELLNLLKDHGHNMTQATLSRDLKELKIAKVPDLNTGYRYIIPNEKNIPTENSLHDTNFLKTGILSIQFSNSLAVIKTRPGYASVIAEMIDSKHVPNILGTIAGDDTVLLVIHENTDRNSVLSKLANFIPNIHNYLIN